MIRGKRNHEYGGQKLRVDCCGWDSYCEAVSYRSDKSQSSATPIQDRGNGLCSARTAQRKVKW